MIIRTLAACAAATLTLFTGTRAAAQTSHLVAIDTTSPKALFSELEADGFDVVGQDRDVHVVVSQVELAELRARGLSLRVTDSGRPMREVLGLAAGSSDGSVPANYQDLAAIEARMAQTAAQHPAIAQVVDLSAVFGAPLTAEGRSIKAMKISANVSLSEDEPAVLIASAHHCRELVTPVIALEAIDRLTDDYGSLPAVTAALDGHEIWIIPVVNPDGYEYVFNVNNFWRKNRRVFSGGTGVDLNRNYPQGWDNACSGSTDQGSSTYKGPSAASESETQAILALSESRRFAKVIDFHSSGREVLWGYDCPTHPYDSYYQSEAIAIAQAAGYGAAERTPSADGEHQQWHHGRRGAWAVLIETETQFQPAYSAALSEAAQVMGAIDWLLARAVPLGGRVTDSCSGAPIEATITQVGVTLPTGEENRSGGAFGHWYANLPPGMHTLRFEAAGYATFETTVAVGAGAASNVDVQMSSGGSIETYCPTTPNSAGLPGQIGFVGSTSVAVNDVTLSASGLPPSQFCLFVQGQTEVQTPLFDGYLCLSNPIIRLGIVAADGNGDATYALDLTALTQTIAEITPGSTWNFQVYYRDPSFGLFESNLTNALRVPFCR